MCFTVHSCISLPRAIIYCNTGIAWPVGLKASSRRQSVRVYAHSPQVSVLYIIMANDCYVDCRQEYHFFFPLQTESFFEYMYQPEIRNSLGYLLRQRLDVVKALRVGVTHPFWL